MSLINLVAAGATPGPSDTIQDTTNGQFYTYASNLVTVHNGSGSPQRTFTDTGGAIFARMQTVAS